MKDTLPARIRFGSFELYLKSGELCEGDRRTLLQVQPFKVLLILIERNGEIATREEIKKKLWPHDTIVEFDHSINVAIGSLRRALGDSADKPKYIETLARRGYRLIVPVERLSAVDSSDQGAPSFRSPLAKGVCPELAEGWETASGLIGKKVSHYRVLEVIGGGGMGLVYKAEDLKLGRRVALKFLPEELASDAVASQRFEREAQTASSLNHPNICTIHEVEEHEGQPFIVMELLEGETLRDRLAGAASGAKAMPLDEALEIAIQICGGLEAAHQKNIIHRDIKPANIFLTTSGQVKILDFGLAKLAITDGETGLEAAEEPPENSPHSAPPRTTLARGDATLTRTGVAMGTAGYMSPEQVRGEKLDARTDLFSFGLVLYEMATGQRAFSGETAAIVRDAILNNSQIPARELNSTIPAKLVSTIDKALEKDREARYQSVSEMRSDLERVGSRKWLPARGSWKWPAAAVVLLTAIAVGDWLYWRWHNTTKLTQNDTIVLADFTNSTSDPVFDDALNTALQVEIEQTPFLNVIGPDKIRGTLRQMNLEEDTRLTPDIASRVCFRSNSKAVVSALIADAGNHYRIRLKAVECETGKPIATTEVEAEHRNEVVKMLGLASARLRRELGEPEALLQRFNQPLEEATSSSLEALQAYTEGRFKLVGESSRLAALPYYKRAVDLDPSFAIAYAYLGAVYFDMSEFVLAMQSEKKAFELRERLDQRSRWFTESLYFDIGTGELEKANEVYTKWIQTFPTDPTPHRNFFASLSALGQHERAIIEAREAVRLEPTRPNYLNLMRGYLNMNRLDEAKAVFAEAQAHKLDDWILRTWRFMVAFCEGDKATMQRELVWEMSHSEGKEWAIQQLGETAFHLGRFRAARHFASKVQGYNPDSADSIADRALQELETGNPRLAKEMAFKALAADPSPGVKANLALIFARTDDAAQSEVLMDQISKLYPLNTMVQEYVLPTIRASIELDKNDAASAIEILKAAAPYELGSTPAFSSLYPVYIRGLAYVKLGRGHEAAMELQKMVDHTGLLQDSVLSPLSRLQLGRAQVMMGDKAAARKSYQDFLTLWKDADPDIPIYKQAKVEYAKL